LLELQQEIDRDGARYIRHSRRASSTSTPMPMTTMSTPSGKSSTPVPDSPSSRAESATPGSGTPVPIPAKISASYTEIQELAAEKVALAEKLIELITRTRAKLDVDISKVRLLQGEPPELVATQATASMNLKPAGLMALASMTSGSVGLGGNVVGGVENFGAPGRNPALAISESLRNALAQPLVEGKGLISTSTSSSASPAASAHATKSVCLTFDL
jgi:chromatin modification-related protein YNG2